MPKKGVTGRAAVVALAAVAGLAAIALAVSQLGGGSSGGGPESGPARKEQPAAQSGVTLQTNQFLTAERAPVPLPAAPSNDAAKTVGAATTGTTAGGGDPALPLPEVGDRKIVQSASLTLGVEDAGKSVQEVENIAAAAGGFISASSVAQEKSGGDSEDRQSATLTIKVPATSFASVMRQLRGIAKERQAESSQATDVTEEFTDLQARQRNLEATEARYLELLQKAQTIPDILTLQDRINSVRLEIERIQGRVNLLNNLSDLATITVQLRPFVPGQQPPSEPGWAQKAWDNAWDASQDAMRALGTVTIVTGVVLAWLAVPAIAIALGWRLLRPRRERKGEA